MNYIIKQEVWLLWHLLYLPIEILQDYIVRISLNGRTEIVHSVMRLIKITSKMLPEIKSCNYSTNDTVK